MVAFLAAFICMSRVVPIPPDIICCVYVVSMSKCCWIEWYFIILVRNHNQNEELQSDGGEYVHVSLLFTAAWQSLSKTQIPRRLSPLSVAL